MKSSLWRWERLGSSQTPLQPFCRQRGHKLVANAGEELGAKLTTQVPDLQADRRGGETNVPGRSRHVQRRHDRLKGFELAQLHRRIFYDIITIDTMISVKDLCYEGL